MKHLAGRPNRREFVSTAALALGAPAVLVPRQAWAAEPVAVEIENGKLRGLRSNGAVSFKGVPYAAPTGGANRFMAPRPVASWPGVRDALRFGDRCVQERETFGDAPVLSWYAQTEPFSEDCCMLNVYTPAADTRRRPVMVYVHGGGYVTGGGGGTVLEGSNLAKFGDVVVVTLNHRLNVFGYTNLQHLDGDQFGDTANAGQLDLIAALRWVNRNIAAFVAFARSGHPANPRMPEWKPYDAATRVTMAVDLDCRAVNDFRGADRIAGSQLRLDPFNRAAILTYKD